ncbi:AIPR family protein [Azohydromonas australica]|uniref:AIPR family protein n=1 Tax=Azohydromonas australica TaxID=364039 RepID=UPI0003FC112D|nr:AIPR family protein [Azohydromonas australica]
MELQDFLCDLQAEVKAQTFAEDAFFEKVTQHMEDIGMTSDPQPCRVSCRIGRHKLRLDGYALSEEMDRLDLFASLYEGVEELVSVSDTDTKAVVEQCVRFLSLCAEGRLAQELDETHDARSLAETVRSIYNDLEQIRVFVLTDKVAKSKSFQTREIGGKAVRLEVMDIQRLHRHWSEGKPRDELVVDFNEISGGPIPCVFVPGGTEDCDYALTAIPGEALRLLYEKFGPRLLEANVRSFLSVRPKGVNAGIQGTLRSAPGRFMAYNNGIVIVADEMRLADAGAGVTGVSWLKGLQIVNGGQTTASIYFTKRKHTQTDLSKVRVPAKIIVMKRDDDPASEEALISDISRYANTQNAVRQSDLSANKPFHIEVERLSLRVYCPDGVGRWFYERAAGSYNTMLAREGNTDARLRVLKETIPLSRRITKTDLAKYLVAWDRRPDIVSLGSQKNFDKFMESLAGSDGSEPPLPTAGDYKAMIAKAKIFRETAKYSRGAFKAGQANIAAYTVSVLADRLGGRIDLERVWNTQSLSSELMAQIQVWAGEVNDILVRSANGRLISEWAKKPECRELVMGSTFSAPSAGIPELA